MLQIEARDNPLRLIYVGYNITNPPLYEVGIHQGLKLQHARGDSTMDTILQDLRHSVRALRRNPGFTTVAVLTLALGIGANTAIFSVVNAVLLRPLPYPEPARLVMAWESENDGGPTLVSPANFVDWTEHSDTCTHIAALRGWDANLSGVDEPERLRGAMVTAELFAALGVAPLAGRTFLPEAVVSLCSATSYGCGVSVPIRR